MFSRNDEKRCEAAKKNSLFHMFVSCFWGISKVSFLSHFPKSFWLFLLFGINFNSFTEKCKTYFRILWILFLKDGLDIMEIHLGESFIHLLLCSVHASLNWSKVSRFLHISMCFKHTIGLFVLKSFVILLS